MSRMRIAETDISTSNVFEILLDQFPDMIHSVDSQGQIVYANRTAEKLLGYAADELLGMNIRQLYADEILPALEKGFKELKRTGEKRVESILKAKDGTRIPVEIRSFGIYDDAGGFIRTFSISRDMREIKRLQNSLVHAGRLAAIGETASGVAHDINNPLTVILLANEMLGNELQRHAAALPGETNERLTSISQNIQRASRSILKLSEHLRNFSRGMAEQYQTVDLFDAIADALFITDNKIKTCGVTVHNRVHKTRHLVWGCPNQIEQVFVNLIANACDAMEEQPCRELRIEAQPATHDGRAAWQCAVADTGPGISPEHQAEIFESFFTTKPVGKGTGLGLSISRSIVNDHQGELTVRTAPGQGATFMVLLPASAAESQAQTGGAC